MVPRVHKKPNEWSFDLQHAAAVALVVVLQVVDLSRPNDI